MTAHRFCSTTGPGRGFGHGIIPAAALALCLGGAGTASAATFVPMLQHQAPLTIQRAPNVQHAAPRGFTPGTRSSSQKMVVSPTPSLPPCGGLVGGDSPGAAPPAHMLAPAGASAYATHNLTMGTPQANHGGAPGQTHQATVVQVYPMHGAAGDTVSLKGVLTTAQTHRPAPYRLLGFTVGGAWVGRARTNLQGVAEVKYVVPSHAGDGLIQATFTGNGYCSGSRGTASFGVIKPYAAYLILESFAGWVGQTVTAKVILSRTYPYSPHAGVAGKRVHLWYTRNDNTRKDLGSAITDAAGIAKVRFKADDRWGVYPLHASVEPPNHELELHVKNGNAIPRLNPVDFQLNPASIIISISGPTNGTIGSKVKFTVTVKRSTDGAPVAGVIVNIGNETLGGTDTSGRVTGSYFVLDLGYTGKEPLTFTVAGGSRTMRDSKTISFLATQPAN